MFIPLVEEEGRFYALAQTEQPPQRVIAAREADRIPLWRLDRKFMDSRGRVHGVYMLAGFADTFREAYPWLARQEEGE